MSAMRKDPKNVPAGEHRQQVQMSGGRRAGQWAKRAGIVALVGYPLAVAGAGVAMLVSSIHSERPGETLSQAGGNLLGFWFALGLIGIAAAALLIETAVFTSARVRRNHNRRSAVIAQLRTGATA